MKTYMKRAYLEVVLGTLLTGFSAYAQSGMRGGPAAGTMPSNGNGASIVHAPPTSFHGGSGVRASVPVQRNMGDPRSFGHHGIAGDRGFGGRREFGRRGDFGDRHFDFHGRHFDHGFGHGRGTVVFVFGVPYYSYYPGYSYPYSGYYDSAPYEAPYYAPGPSTEYTSAPDTQTEQYANQGADSYYQPGNQWGGELKLYHVTMDQFVAYLKSYILTASPVQQAAFRSGFVAQFGSNGQTMYDQAVQQAIQQNPAAS